MVRRAFFMTFLFKDAQKCPGWKMLSTLGVIAQLGEHLPCKQGVVGSIPTGSNFSADFIWLKNNIFEFYFLNIVKTMFKFRCSLKIWWEKKESWVI